MNETPELHIETATITGYPLLRLGGVVDFNTAHEFREVLRDWVKQKKEAAVIDLREVDKIDTAGIATIIESVEDMRGYGGRVVLVHDNEHIERAFKVAGREGCCEDCATEQEAVALLTREQAEPPSDEAG